MARLFLTSRMVATKYMPMVSARASTVMLEVDVMVPDRADRTCGEVDGGRRMEFHLKCMTICAIGLVP